MDISAILVFVVVVISCLYLL